MIDQFEWSKSTLTKNNLAAPRILHVAFVAKHEKQTKALTACRSCKTCLVTKLSGDYTCTSLDGAQKWSILYHTKTVKNKVVFKGFWMEEGQRAQQ